MSPSLDLNLLSLQRQNGKENPNHPGLYMATPPRRTGRGRGSDLLVLYLSVAGNSPIDERSQEQILGRLAQIYYKTSGSVTAALKTIGEYLNKYLLERNLRSTSSGQQGIGLFTAAVLREERLTLAICGPSHVFIVQAGETQHIHDPQTAGRGLGLTRSLSIRFFQTSLQPNDILVLTPQPPPSWSKDVLQNVHGQGIESLRRRLLSQAGPNLNAFVAYAQTGTGKLRLLRSKLAVQMVQPITGSMDAPAQIHGKSSNVPAEGITAPAEMETPVEAPGLKASKKEPQEGDLDFLLPFEVPEPAIPGLEINSEDLVSEAGGEFPSLFEEATEGPPDEQTQVPASASGETADAIDTPAPQGLSKSEELADPAPVTVQTSAGAASRTSFLPMEPVKRHTRNFSSFLRTNFNILGSYFGTAARWIARVFLNLLKRILPDESLFSIPASTMAFTAVAVALVIATAGAVMYFQRGQAAQYQAYFEQAQQAAALASEQTDPVELKTGWDTTLFYLDKAETFKLTSESNSLRLQAQQALDELDYIFRLSFQSTFIGGLGNSANIQRMAATHDELFMYNANGGNILRATLRGTTFEIDNSFSCSQSLTSSQIVDITPLPKGNSLKSIVMGLDIHGNLLLCAPGEGPKTTSLAPPNLGWKSPTAFRLDNNNLYVLDPQNNAVWIYWDMDFTNPPHLYFGEQVPNQMEDAVDLAVNRDDLYLLHSDGRITTCKFSRLRESPTRCVDPAGYYDPRPGRQHGSFILDAQFQQILFTPSPDSSIYLFDPLNQSVYHFSLRLNLQRQFRTANRLAADTATAFTVSPSRTLFMATGSQVYYTQLP
jgi:hypothetical protein